MKKRAVIAIDEWKLSIFLRHLQQSGYKAEQGNGLVSNTLTLYVETSNVEALTGVINAAERECKRTGKPS